MASYLFAFRPVANLLVLEVRSIHRAAFCGELMAWWLLTTSTTGNRAA